MWNATRGSRSRRTITGWCSLCKLSKQNLQVTLAEAWIVAGQRARDRPRSPRRDRETKDSDHHPREPEEPEAMDAAAARERS